MIDRYKEEFGEMHERVFNNRENLLDVIEDYISSFEKEGIGRKRVIDSFAYYIKQR